MLGWIQFAVTAALIAMGISALFVSILGTYRFRFSLNRIHSAAISDTFCMFFILAGLAVASGFSFATLKILLILAFMWCTSPISAHMLASLEYHTDEHLEQHCEFRRLKSKEEE